MICLCFGSGPGFLRPSIFILRGWIEGLGGTLHSVYCGWRLVRAWSRCSVAGQRPQLLMLQAAHNRLQHKHPCYPRQCLCLPFPGWSCEHGLSHWPKRLSTGALPKPEWKDGSNTIRIDKHQWERRQVESGARRGSVIHMSSP